MLARRSPSIRSTALSDWSILSCSCCCVIPPDDDNDADAGSGGAASALEIGGCLGTAGCFGGDAGCLPGDLTAEDLAGEAGGGFGGDGGGARDGDAACCATAAERLLGLRGGMASPLSSPLSSAATRSAIDEHRWCSPNQSQPCQRLRESEYVSRYRP
eukprot:6489110-Prymnesium_polylepis.1